MAYRYDVYRHATSAILAAKTGCNTKPATQQLARVLKYLDDVRTAYVARVRRGSVTDEAWFCPELEYHMWLDFVERAYHDVARTSIQNNMNITFNYVMQRKQPDISTFSKLSDKTSQL